MRPIDELIASVRAEAERADFPIDRPVYERSKKDALAPVLFAGSLDAKVAVMGRDLGKDEVAAGQPLIGAGGRLVRVELFKVINGEDPPATDRRLESVLEHVLLTNTVPYKPPGNKAYATSVKERFRPLIEELLVEHWKGDRLITLGNEAFHWFAKYAEPAEFEAFWKREDRYEAAIACQIKSGGKRKALTLLPLPHPSPLNARWYGLFPGLLAQRLRPIFEEK